jgi:gliding motility-associated-like protein
MASPPVVSNVEICAGDVATLTAAGSGTIQWYSSPLPGTPISSGYEFVTPELTSITTYYVLSQDADCKSPLVPVTVNVEDCDNIIVPNIFTPNGDDVNDQLFFHSNASRCFHCRIYNRWGTLVYELNDAAGGWNGTVLKTGKSAPDGVYYYILDYCTFSDEKELAGFVQLIRE